MQDDPTEKDNQPAGELCPNWDAVTNAFDQFPPHKFGFSSEVVLTDDLWVFRGHKASEYRLEPSIEREASQKLLEWPALELKILEEFQPRARMHLDPSDIPPPDDRLSWLALTQHYGVPTRLLDFSFSPYVALYFAVRNRAEKEREASVRVWAIDARALMKAAGQVSGAADQEELEYERRKAGVTIAVRTASLDPRFFTTDREMLQNESARLNRMLLNALSPCGIRRARFYEDGFVALAMPTIQNRRLSSQQGAFLFSGAEDIGFQDSLFRMMKGCKTRWYKCFDIPNKETFDIERRLFQMNIHDLSLFPDMEGLAGFVRQKTRLYWGPND